MTFRTKRRSPRLLGVLAMTITAVVTQFAAAGGASAIPPSFTVTAAPTSLPNYNNAGEPSVGVDWKTGNVMYQAYTSTYKITPPGSASPLTWSNASSPYSQINLDPILWTDAPQGRTLAGGLSG